MLILVTAVFLLSLTLLFLPHFRLGVIDVEQPLVGGVTVGDFLIVFSLFSGSVTIGLFLLMLLEKK